VFYISEMLLTACFMLSVDSRTFLRQMMSYPICYLEKCDIKLIILLSQLMHISTRNICVKFNPDPVWNDGAL